MMKSEKNVRPREAAWQSLNLRQQTYMRLIYEEDQVQERSERQRAAWDKRSLPAEEWRWILYANTMSGHTPLKQKIKDAGMVDPGTGSTFEALEKRGYILTRSEGATPHRRSELIVHVRLTTQGRKLVREALHLAAPKKTVGMLQEWHWRALAKAYAAGSAGVPSNGIGYGRIGWNTWLRLRDFKIKGVEYPLIEEGISITPFGTAYYERSYQRYRDLYPGVEALAPAHPIDPHAPYVEELQDSRRCRACFGVHLVAITRSYQQDHKWVWSVQEQEHRIPGDATARHRTSVEQCRCDEQDIQEVSMPFLDLLDQLSERGWRVRFPGGHAIYYLEFLVSCITEGRAFYDPALAKQHLLPLMGPTDREEHLNIVKGEIRYCWNEHVGSGCVYTPALGPFAKVPVVITRREEND